MRWPWDHLEIDESTPPEPEFDVLAKSTGVILTHSDLGCLSDAHRRAIFSNRVIGGVRWTSENYFFIDWKLADDMAAVLLNTEREARPIEGVPLSDDATVGFSIHQTTDNVYKHCILNITNSLGHWIFGLKRRCSAENCFVDSRMLKTLVSLLQTPLSHSGFEVEKLESYLKRWREIPNLLPEFYPPEYLPVTRHVCSSSRLNVNDWG